MRYSIMHPSTSNETQEKISLLFTTDLYMKKCKSTLKGRHPDDTGIAIDKARPNGQELQINT